MVVFEDASKGDNNFKTGAIRACLRASGLTEYAQGIPENQWPGGAPERRARWLTRCSRAAKDAAVSSSGFLGSDEAAVNYPEAA